MQTVTYSLGIAGASMATGPTIVIDTFRAFTTAAVLFDRGVGRIILCDDVNDARDTASHLGALLCGEVGGAKPEGFDFGNSPWEATSQPSLAGSIVVQRTSSGTRSVLAAINAGARPVLAASLVVASATAEAVRDFDAVTIVSAGQDGTDAAEEDDLTAAHIAALLSGTGIPETATALLQSERASFVAEASWGYPEDVDIAADVDRFPFAMLAERTSDGLVDLRTLGR
ncbi:MAG: 2-phosphosulfolactate phosphatase [Acidimicrobiia bacterium]